MADDGLASPPPRVAARQIQRRVFPGVEQVGDQAEQLGGRSSPAVFRRRVHGVLDDPHQQRRAVLLAGRRQLRQVSAVSQDLHRLEGEGRRGAPQDVRPGRQELPGQRPGQELAVRQHQHLRPEAAALQQVAGQRLLAVPVRPRVAPSRLPVPDSAAASHRTCANAPSRAWLDGRPKCSSFGGLSGTSEVDPSMETTRSPQQNTPGVPSSPIGPATCSNRNRTGAGPSLPRPRDSEEMFGCRHRRPSPAPTQPPGSSCCPASRSAARRWWYSPSASLVITCPYPQFRPRNSHSASTKYTISRAGSSRRRCSRAPASSTAASTSSGVKTLVSTPTEIRSGGRQRPGCRPALSNLRGSKKRQR